MNVSPESEHITVAGHGPAQRAGKMRIKHHKRQTSKEAVSSKNSESDDGGDAELSMSPPKPLVVAGSQTRGDADFPPEAIRSFHYKPRPNCESTRAQPRTNIIHQPKKF